MENNGRKSRKNKWETFKIQNKYRKSRKRITKKKAIV